MSDDEIRNAFLQMVRRANELALRVMALQTLLQQAGHFSATTVEERIEEIRKLWEPMLQKRLSDLFEKEGQSELRRLLESYEGPKQ